MQCEAIVRHPLCQPSLDALGVLPPCKAQHSIIGIPDTAVGIDVVDPVDLRGMIEGLDSYIIKLAQVTDTPISRFQMTRQIAAEGTLKQQEEPLLAKVRARQVLFGNSWEDVLYMSRRQANVFGRAGMDEDSRISTQWKPPETRDDKAFLETLVLKSELGVPDETIWAELGYDETKVAEFKAQRAQAMAEQSNIGGELLRAFERGT